MLNDATTISTAMSAHSVVPSQMIGGIPPRLRM